MRIDYFPIAIFILKDTISPQAIRLLLPTNPRQIDPHPSGTDFLLVQGFGVGRRGSGVCRVISSPAVDRLTLIGD